MSEHNEDVDLVNLLQAYMAVSCPRLTAAWEKYSDETGEEKIGVIRDGVIEQYGLSPIGPNDNVYEDITRWEEELKAKGEFEDATSIVGD